MSVQFDFREITVGSLEQWPVTVCAWRGCCMEVFARAEHSIADCLNALGQAGIMLPKEARSPAATMRLRALRTCIERHDFAKQGEVARRRIDKWETLCKARASLAHGRIKAVADGVIVTHRVFDGKAELPHPVEHLSRLDMLAKLQEMSRAQQLLHQQLGQIKALARHAACASSGS